MPETDTIPVSASVASVGNSLRYIGSHCYALSGDVSANTSAQIILNYTTGSGYIVGIFQFNAFIDTAGDPTDGAIGICKIKFNNEQVIVLKTSGQSEAMPAYATSEVILPPFTKVEAKLDAGETASGKVGSINFTGRVYGEA